MPLNNPILRCRLRPEHTGARYRPALQVCSWRRERNATSLPSTGQSRVVLLGSTPVKERTVKDDPNNDDNNNSVCTPLLGDQDRTNLPRTYGPDPDFDPVLSRWNESAS